MRTLDDVLVVAPWLTLGITCSQFAIGLSRSMPEALDYLDRAIGFCLLTLALLAWQIVRRIRR